MKPSTGQGYSCCAVLLLTGMFFFPSTAFAEAPPVNLSGVWSADDGGVYYMRQVGDLVLWAGFSEDGGQSFTNVFCGMWKVNEAREEPADYGTLAGDWSDVPRGKNRGHGQLTIQVRFPPNGGKGPAELLKLSGSGFAAKVWKPIGAPKLPQGGPPPGHFLSRTALTGTWSATDNGTYYLCQVGTTVWWLGLSNDDGISFANVFRGTIENGNTIKGTWADVPRGHARNSGALNLFSESRTMTSQGQGRVSFEGYRWEKRN